MNDDTLPSKTRRKKQMAELQDLGAELVELSEQRLAQTELPDNLRDAVIAARRMSKFEARRRQLQYIGKLMRRIDAEPIRAQLEVWKSGSREHTVWLHRIERWRERLLADESALNELIGECPHADGQRLRALIRNTLRERELNKPPRNFRALFRALHEMLAENREE